MNIPPKQPDFSETAQPEAANLYQRMLDLSLEGLLRIDAADRVTYANGRMTEMLGYALGELEGRLVLDLLFPEEAESARQRRAARRAGVPEQYEARLRRKDGSECWTIARVSVFLDDGVYSGSFSLFTDITERKQAEEALRRSEQDLQLAVSAARLGTFYCEWPFDKITWNETCKQHFFLPVDAEVDFTLFYSLLHPDDRERTRTAIDWAMQEHVEYNVEYRVLASDGRTRWVNAVGRGYYDSAGVPLRFDGVTIDITARKQTETELAEALLRETLVNRISQAIRAAQEQEQILRIAVDTLGAALNVDHCYYVTYDLDRGRGILGPEWQRTGRESLAGEYEMFHYNYNRDSSYLTGQTHIVEDTYALPESEGNSRSSLRALIRAPLSPGPVMTSLGVAMADQPRLWTANEIMLVETVASQTQAALESALVREREHRIATALQDALQPAAPEDIPGLSLAYFTKPALDEAAIGGDFFDVFPLDKELYAIVIGDVSGKGLAAAAQLATVRNMLRAVLYQYRSVAVAVAGLNTIVTAHDLLAGFVTLFTALYDARTGDVIYTSCGHEPGLLHRAADGQVARLDSTGPPLGVADNAVYTEGRVTLTTGDMLFLYTDGLSEAGPNRRDLLGTDGLTRFLRTHAAHPELSTAVAMIVADTGAFAEGRFHDDVCTLLLRRL
jgi:PAS domain S-box-containing protein